jgi:hypothetical protein
MKEEQKTDSKSDGEREEAQNTSSFSTRLQAGSELMFYCALPLPLSAFGLFDRNFSQADVLDHGPDNHEATGLGCEHVDLIGALPQEAPQTLNGIGRLNVPMPAGRELVKRQALLFFLSQTSHGLGIAWYAFSYRTQA